MESLEDRRLLAVDHVVHISVDGLSATLLQPLVEEELETGAGHYATYARLSTEGAVTFNARTDFTHTNTLPNHVSIVTGRPVLKPDGQSNTVAHLWTSNTDPSPGETLHNHHPALDYLASTFDVVHDAGLSTGLFASKSKFSLFEVSYNDEHGAPDSNPAGGDNGRNKIDFVRIENDTESLVDAFTQTLADQNLPYSFVHLRDPDSVGHASGWGSAQWRQAVRHTDRLLGKIMQTIDGDPELRNDTAIIVTSDHGGTGNGHGNPRDARNYRIPFYVWGAGLPAGEDLYSVFATTTADPGDGRPDYNAPGQPIRNADSGNLAVDLLDLPAIRGSVVRSLVPEAPAGDLVQFRLEVTDSHAAPATMVYVGTEVTLTARVQDLRTPPAGVASAYADVLYASQLVTPDGPITYGPAFSEGQSGSTLPTGRLDEVGARRRGSIASPDEDLLFQVPFRALAAGNVQFQAEPADEPDHGMTLSGRETAVPDHRVRFDDAAFQIISFHNRDMPMDVNEDRLVSPSDVLAIVNDINNIGTGNLVDLYPLLGADNQLVDVNRDGNLSPLDALIIINSLNQRRPAARHAVGFADPIAPRTDPWFAGSLDRLAEASTTTTNWTSHSAGGGRRTAFFAAVDTAQVLPALPPPVSRSGTTTMSPSAATPRDGTGATTPGGQSPIPAAIDVVFSRWHDESWMSFGMSVDGQLTECAARPS